MTWPFENDTSSMVKKLADRRIRANKGRNVFVVLAVILTTVLFAAFFSVCGGLLDQIKQSKEQQYGGRAHASIKFLSESQYEELVSSDKKKEISYTRLVGAAVNRELSKTMTEVRYAEEEAAEAFFCYPTTGTMPRTGHEIATSTLVLDALGIPHELGSTVHLNISVDGKSYEGDFQLAGFWEGYALAPAQEIWVSRDFADRVAPASKQTYEEMSGYAGLYCAEVNFSHSWNIEKSLKNLLEDTGLSGVPADANPCYGHPSIGDIDMFFFVSAFALLGTILFAGYLIIYNLFYISVSQDIHFFGVLKTIGASSRQIERIVRRQAFHLAALGLPFGLLLGYMAGYVLLPFILTQINIGDTGTYRINPLILIGAALFSLLTVYISSLKPCNYAAKVSPIEAVRYSGENETVHFTKKKAGKIRFFSMAKDNLRRDRKKVILVVLSLSFSLVLLNTTYTAVNGFDMDKYIAKYMTADFLVADFSVRNYGYVYDAKDLSGVSQRFLSEMERLPGLENSANVYAKEVFQALPDDLAARFQEMRAGTLYESDDKFWTFMQVYGIDDNLTDQLVLMEGEWDPEKWNTGKYLIVHDFFYADYGKSPFYQLGDEVSLFDQNGMEHIYTVMAVGKLSYNLDAQYYVDQGLRMILPQESYHTLYGETQPLCTVFNIDDANTESAENWVSDYCKNVETNLEYISHRTYEQEFLRDKLTYVMIGGLLAVILALIGLLNFVNAVATSIIARKKELALLNAVGMSKKQVKYMLISESLAYIGLSVLFTATLGTGLCYLICEGLVSDLWEFTYHFTLIPVLCCLPFLLAIAIAIPLWFHKSLDKISIVERLRTI